MVKYKTQLAVLKTEPLIGTPKRFILLSKTPLTPWKQVCYFQDKLKSEDNFNWLSKNNLTKEYLLVGEIPKEEPVLDDKLPF